MTVHFRFLRKAVRIGLLGPWSNLLPPLTSGQVHRSHPTAADLPFDLIAVSECSLQAFLVPHVGRSGGSGLPGPSQSATTEKDGPCVRTGQGFYRLRTRHLLSNRIGLYPARVDLWEVGELVLYITRMLPRQGLEAGMLAGGRRSRVARG